MDFESLQWLIRGTILISKNVFSPEICRFSKNNSRCKGLTRFWYNTGRINFIIGGLSAQYIICALLWIFCVFLHVIYVLCMLVLHLDFHWMPKNPQSSSNYLQRQQIAFGYACPPYKNDFRRKNSAVILTNRVDRCSPPRIPKFLVAICQISVLE